MMMIMMNMKMVAPGEIMIMIIMMIMLKMHLVRRRSPVSSPSSG